MSALKPEIWTYDQFKAETNPKAVRKALAGIDVYLQEWVGMKDGRSTEQRLIHLRKIAKDCGDYLQAKEGKKAKKDAARFGKASDRLVNRIAKVKLLSGQVFLRLAFERYNYQKNVRSGDGTKLATAAAQATGLKGTYAHERSNFVATKAAQNLAGTQTAINPQGASYVHQKIDEHQAQAVQAPAALVALLNKGFDNLTLQEFNTIQAHFAQGQPGLGHLPNVHFARKDERFRELMLVPLDGLLYKSNGSLCDVGWNAYAVDIYGNLLIAKANRSWQHGQGGAQFNHSTLAAGRDVICAGEIRIVKGLIEYISNESGHYKPTALQLANAIFVLSEEYQLPLIDSLTEVVDIAGGNKVTHDGLLPFLVAHPGAH
jgi:hypothetical protein